MSFIARGVLRSQKIANFSADGIFSGLVEWRIPHVAVKAKMPYVKIINKRQAKGG